MEPHHVRRYSEGMTQQTPPSPPRRVLLQTEDAEAKKGRGGCLAMGAVLGIIFGIMVGLYALPPILKSIYGEKVVAVGEVYETEGRTIRVTEVTAGRDPLEEATGDVITVVVRTTGWPTNEPRPGRYRLEVETVDDWVNPLGQPANAPPPADLAPGEQEVILRFPIPAGLTVETVRAPDLHLEDPLVKFELPAAEIVR